MYMYKKMYITAISLWKKTLNYAVTFDLIVTKKKA